MDFTNRPRETVDIPRATAEQALNALDLAQRILQSTMHPDPRRFAAPGGDTREHRFRQRRKAVDANNGGGCRVISHCDEYSVRRAR